MSQKREPVSYAMIVGVSFVMATIGSAASRMLVARHWGTSITRALAVGAMVFVGTLLVVLVGSMVTRSKEVASRSRLGLLRLPIAASVAAVIVVFIIERF